jgi:hypothetical protein
MHYYATMVGDTVTLRAMGKYSDGHDRPFVPSSWSTLAPATDITLTPSPDGTCVVTAVGASFPTVQANYLDGLGKPQNQTFQLKVEPAGDIAYFPPKFLGVSIVPQ